MPKPYYHTFTQAGFDTVKAEYDELLSKRPTFVEELAKAREMGDRSENAAYKFARQKLSRTDSRMRFLKKLLDNARIAEAMQTDYVVVGSVVKVHNGTKEIVFHIVGEHEADPINARLSYKSPVGQALLSKKVGDSISVTTPNGEILYKIVSISLE